MHIGFVLKAPGASIYFVCVRLHTYNHPIFMTIELLWFIFIDSEGKCAAISNYLEKNASNVNENFLKDSMATKIFNR